MKQYSTIEFDADVKFSTARHQPLYAIVLTFSCKRRNNRAKERDRDARGHVPCGLSSLRSPSPMQVGWVPAPAPHPRVRSRRKAGRVLPGVTRTHTRAHTHTRLHRETVHCFSPRALPPRTTSVREDRVLKPSSRWYCRRQRFDVNSIILTSTSNFDLTPSPM